ncbi:hypothetical protein [Maricaulis sp.]|uniref:hypothetical protein n=1 Tax=Maricaulis sp. TaxID=1486257 RepID=UPI0025BF060A|nr:hypothetical protein [Maricaulis sp.]
MDRSPQHGREHACDDAFIEDLRDVMAHAVDNLLCRAWNVGRGVLTGLDWDQRIVTAMDRFDGLTDRRQFCAPVTFSHDRRILAGKAERMMPAVKIGRCAFTHQVRIDPAARTADREAGLNRAVEIALAVGRRIRGRGLGKEWRATGRRGWQRNPAGRHGRNAATGRHRDCQSGSPGVRALPASRENCRRPVCPCFGDPLRAHPGQAG